MTEIIKSNLDVFLILCILFIIGIIAKFNAMNNKKHAKEIVKNFKKSEEIKSTKLYKPDGDYNAEDELKLFKYVSRKYRIMINANRASITYDILGNLVIAHALFLITVINQNFDQYKNEIFLLIALSLSIYGLAYYISGKVPVIDNKRYDEVQFTLNSFYVLVLQIIALVILFTMVLRITGMLA